MQKQTSINSIVDLKQEYPEQFDKLGTFPREAKLHIKDDAEPFIDAPRKCPIHIKDELKLEIDNLVIQGVIRKVEEHTDWCSSLAFSTKNHTKSLLWKSSTHSLRKPMYSANSMRRLVTGRYTLRRSHTC